MNRSELVKVVAERAGSDEAAARRHVDAVFEAVMDSVSAGERVVVTGFGAFDRFARPARSARNPRTGLPVEVPAAQVPRFRFGQTFRNRVAQGGGDAAVEEAPAAEVVDGAPAEAPAAVKKPKKDKKAAAKKAPEKAPKKGKGKAAPKQAASAAKPVSKAVAKPAPKKKAGKAKARAKSAK